MAANLWITRYKRSFSRHSDDLSAEIEPLHDGPDVGRKAVDIAVQIRRELIGVIQQALEIELRQVATKPPSMRCVPATSAGKRLVASTASVRRAESQIRALFGRRRIVHTGRAHYGRAHI